MNRPALNNKISAKDFKEFYWLKEELIIFCKANGINRNGGKIIHQPSQVFKKKFQNLTGTMNFLRRKLF